MFEMLGSIVKNLFTSPATRLYPTEVRKEFKDTRGKIGIDMKDCIFCNICARKCPSDAITVNKEQKSWEIDPFKCIICNVCVDVCPKKCIVSEEKYTSSAYKKEKLKYYQGKE